MGNPATQTLGGRPLSPEQKFSTADLPGVRCQAPPLTHRLENRVWFDRRCRIHWAAMATDAAESWE